MILSFDCDPDEAEEVLHAVALRMQVLTQQGVLPEDRSIEHLLHFARQLGPIAAQNTPSQVLVLEVQV